jgi:hypothetical protein
MRKIPEQLMNKNPTFMIRICMMIKRIEVR